jgi:dihydroneopterin aldolase
VTLTIVKVGGSFCRFPRLPDVVGSLAEGAARTVIVPGGGPFADCVRAEQKRVGFDDRAAHRMALLAMAEFGYVLASFSERLVPAAGMSPIRGALAEGLVPVWLPLDLRDGAPDVPESWDMTSDSLSAWLAGRLGAERLIFLKRVRAPRSNELHDLVADGVLDPFVPRFLGRSVEAWLCGPRELRKLGQALARGDAIGRRIERA